MNKQGNLNEFFDVSAGSGTYAPRKRQAYTSKRLQQVVTEFRNERAKSKASNPAASESGAESGAETSEADIPAKKRRNTGTSKAKRDTMSNKNPSKRGRGRGRAAKSVSTRKNRASTASQMTADSEDGDGEFVGDLGDAMGSVPELRPRPKPKPALLHRSSELDTGTDT